MCLKSTLSWVFFECFFIEQGERMENLRTEKGDNTWDEKLKALGDRFNTLEKNYAFVMAQNEQISLALEKVLAKNEALEAQHQKDQAFIAELSSQCEELQRELAEVKKEHKESQAASAGLEKQDKQKHQQGAEGIKQLEGKVAARRAAIEKNHKNLREKKTPTSKAGRTSPQKTCFSSPLRAANSTASPLPRKQSRPPATKLQSRPTLRGR